ncbi:MAG: hypothetical protein H7099_09465 [Gemmatimonadaceae bacterium]|nr:hypothetical protein [Gemmatimonadaceae bacterium]
MTRTSGARRPRHVVALLLLLAPLVPCAAQRVLPPARPMLLRPALRADAIIDRDPGAQFALGLAVASTYNVRLELDAGVGGVSRSAGWVPTGRLDLLARWLSDPFRQSRWGISAGAGIGQRVESERTPATVAIVTLGIEGPSDGTWVPGVEIGLGGGLRAGVTFRRAPLRQR